MIRVKNHPQNVGYFHVAYLDFTIEVVTAIHQNTLFVENVTRVDKEFIKYSYLLSLFEY